MLKKWDRKGRRINNNAFFYRLVSPGGFFRVIVSNLQFVWNQNYVTKIWCHLLNSTLRKIGWYGTILCSILCWVRLDVVFLTLRSRNFWRVNLFRFVWLSCSISINSACILKLCPSMSKWFDTHILPFLMTFFLWLLSLILNSVSDFLTYCIWHFKHSNKYVCVYRLPIMILLG